MAIPAEVANRNSKGRFVRRPKGKSESRVEVDFEKTGFSNHHKLWDKLNTQNWQQIQDELMEAEVEGRFSRAKKLRTKLNQEIEVHLMLQGTWCGGCGQTLRQCRCQIPPRRGRKRFIDRPIRKERVKKQKSLADYHRKFQVVDLGTSSRGRGDPAVVSDLIEK